RTSTSPCAADAVCTGNDAACPPNPPVNGAVCRDGNACTVEDRCEGGECAPGSPICSVNAIHLGGRIVATCRAERTRAGATCRVTGRGAAGAWPLAALTSRAAGSSTSRCSPKRVKKLAKRVESLSASCAADGTRVELCRSATKQLKAAGSPVRLKCKPT